MPEKCWTDGEMLGGAGFLEWALAACLRSRGDRQCAKLRASFAKMAEQPPGQAAESLFTAGGCLLPCLRLGARSNT